MIETLEVGNYKGHLHSKLKFHRGINVITGSSDAGKSTLLKSLLWVLTNRPTGSGMVSFWNRTKKGDAIKPTFSKIGIAGESITRVKDSSRNGYDIPGNEGDNGLGAIGTSVPEQVTTLLNMSDLNVAKQFDPPFLIGETPGEVARYLNKLIKLEEIDTVLVNVESQKRSVRKQVESISSQVDILENSIKEWDWVEGATDILESAKKVEQSLENVSTAIGSLETHSDTLALLEKRLESKSTLENLKGIFSLIDYELKELGECSSTILGLSNDLSKLEELEGVLDVPTKAIAKILADIDKLLPTLTKALADLHTLTVLENALDKNEEVLMHNDILDSLSNVFRKIDNSREVVSSLDKQEKVLSELQSTLGYWEETLIEKTSLMKELEREFPEDCPVCGHKGEHTHA